MDELQLYELIKTTLLALTWTGGKKVFGSGAISAGPEQSSLEHMRKPVFLIRAGTGRNDDYDPELINQGLSVVIIVGVPGGPACENAMIGANIIDVNSSEGKGLFAIQRKLYEGIIELSQVDGVTINSRGRGSARPLMMTSGYHVQRDYRFEAKIVSEGA